MDGGMAPHQAKHLDMELFQRLLKQAVFSAPDFMGEAYPLVNYHSYWKSPFFMGKSTTNGHFQ
jgi:hypothetical protein